MSRRTVFAIILMMILSLGGIPCPAAGFDTGIAITPRNFPKHSAKDVNNAFKLAKGLANYSVFIYQWHELKLDVVKLMMQTSKHHGLVPIIGLSPTTLDKGRKELDLPPTLRRKASRRLSFANPAIRRAFIRTAKGLARLKPEFLCLATEINFLALQRLDEYLNFVSLYKQAYAKIKKISPKTKVFVSFQWEWVRILDSKEMDKIGEHSKVINVFRPELDLIAITTYPAPFHDHPSQLPRDYYSWIYRHVNRQDTIMIMEAGWPTSGKGSNTEQRAYMRRLSELLAPVKVNILAWALLHDVNLKQFDANLNSVGILDASGEMKPAFAVFKTYKK